MAPQTVTMSPADFDKLPDAPAPATPQASPAAPQSSTQSVTVSPSDFEKLPSVQPAATQQPSAPTPSIGPPASTSQRAENVIPGDVPDYAKITPNPLSMGMVKALIRVHDAIKGAEGLTQEGRQAHPIEAKLGDTAAAIEGLLTGNTDRKDQAIGTGEYGVLTNPATAPIIPAGEESVGAKALSKTVDTAAAAKDSVAATPAVQKVSEIAQDIKQGKEAAQAPAQAAIRESVGAADNAPILQGNKSVLDQKLSDLTTQKQSAYKQMDDAVGFDLKAEKDSLANDQYKLKQLGNTDTDQAMKEKLQTSIADSQQRITDAESTLKERGIDPKGADKLNQQLMAGKQVKKALVQSTDSQGNVNVEGFLNRVKNLRFDKFGDRPAQFFGKDGADQLVQNLQEAHNQGIRAVNTQKIYEFAKKTAITTGIGAGAYELTKAANH